MFLIQLTVELVSGEPDLVGVDHDHEVTGIDVRGKDRFVFTTQNTRNIRSEATQWLVRRIDYKPTSFDFGGLRTVCGHVHCSIPADRRTLRT